MPAGYLGITLLPNLLAVESTLSVDDSYLSNGGKASQRWSNFLLRKKLENVDGIERACVQFKGTDNDCPSVLLSILVDTYNACVRHFGD